MTKDETPAVKCLPGFSSIKQQTAVTWLTEIESRSRAEGSGNNESQLLKRLASLSSVDKYKQPNNWVMRTVQLLWPPKWKLVNTSYC